MPWYSLTQLQRQYDSAIHPVRAPATTSSIEHGTSSSLLKNLTCVLRQAQHERETLIVSMLFSLILRLSKDEQRVFQQTASALV